MIRLQKIKYSEWEGTPQEWTLDELSLAESNLVVGKNATGKSRTLNVISGLAKLLIGIEPIRLSGNYDVEFIWDDKIIEYKLQYQKQEVITEVFLLDGVLKLDRSFGGQGKIWAEQIKDYIQFQTPTSELAALARQDNIQHKFLEPLYSWGSSLRHYYFGTSLGKNLLGEKKGRQDVNDRDPNVLIVSLYRQAENEFGNRFKKIVIKDMDRIGYSLSNLGTKPPISLILFPNQGTVVGLYAQEKSLSGITDQVSMSQGMFRALSLLIQINYSQMAHKSTCILVDDIGEGLDFERSCQLIDILREKAKASNTQLILSTNDQFIMNQVPLEEWIILDRQGGKVINLNYRNSKALFDKFDRMGLNNFDLFSSEYYKRG
jgi:energy-coupling factor transporter ATP-binding protein EcfA2